MKSVTHLSKLEIYTYFVIWCTVVGYSIYNLYILSKEIGSYNLPYGYFDEGWPWIGRKRDIFDHEWSIVIDFIYKISPWIFVHLSFSEILRQFCLYELLPIWYTIITLCYLIYTFKLWGTILLLVQPCITILIITCNSEKMIWIFSILIIIFINTLQYSFTFNQALNGIDDDSYYMLIVSMSWMTLKCISCGLDNITNNTLNNREMSVGDLKNSIGYMMYLPTLLFGPLQLYYEFEDFFMRNKIFRNFKTRLKQLIMNVFRYTCWYLFTEFCLHFIYVNVLQSYLEVVAKNSWAIYGLGYCMGQFFHLKYIVIYGLTTSIMKVEEIKAPPTPICIGHVHLYSYMWKYFDYGLYRFLVRYIYLPSGGGSNSKPIRRLFSSFLCFCFVFIWHGMQMFILIWSLLNFIGVTVEKIWKELAQYNKYYTYMCDTCSASTIRRLNAVICSPLMIMSALSNFFFLGEPEVGYFFIRYVLTASVKSHLILFGCVYTLCQVSTEIINSHKNKHVLKK